MRISPTEVITAEHVITGAGRVDVSVEGGTYQRATVTGYDTDRDLALLLLDNPVAGMTVELPFANLSQRSVADIGYEVALIRPVPSTSNITPLVTFGRIGALWDIRPGNYAIGQQETVSLGFGQGEGAFQFDGVLSGDQQEQRGQRDSQVVNGKLPVHRGFYLRLGDELV